MSQHRTIHILLALAGEAALLLAAFGAPAAADPLPDRPAPARGSALDQALAATLAQARFTGRIQASLAQRLGRPVNARLANVGRLLWFDTLTGLNDDNTCAGCHSPTAGFGDTQSIAIGIQNNSIVGPHRAGPRNMRRTPTAINTAFYANLMWNSRFAALSSDPFDNGAGFLFPAPEALTLSGQPHLLAAQAFIPPTERTEVAGFDFPGDNDAIRAEVLSRLNANANYRALFGRIFPAVRAGAPISFDQFGQAIAEFEFSLTFANASLDQFARGQRSALTDDEKQGALLFFGAAGCVKCHSVAGAANEMFSDFQDHVAGAPQIAPRLTNNSFDGAGANEDYGHEDVTGDPADRYKFRTSPLRNVALQPTFMHNGAFTSLEAAIRYHLDAAGAAPGYTPTGQGLAADLSGPLGPTTMARLDPLLATPVRLSKQEFKPLVAFVRYGLLDARAAPARLRRLVPQAVPSGRPVLAFEFP